MSIHVVSAHFLGHQWRAVKAFVNEDDADAYAMKIYEEGLFGKEVIIDSRVDEVNLISEEV